MKKRKIFISMLLVVSSLLACGCSAKANKEKVVVVGMNTNNKPFSINNGNDLEGFDIELLKLIEEDLGIKFSIEHTPKVGLIPNLKQNQYDVVFSGISKKEAYDISEDIKTTLPYLDVKDVVLVHTNDKKTVSLSDLANKKIGVKSNTLQEKSINNLVSKNITPKEVINYSSMADAISDLQNGNIDAVCVSDWYANTVDFEDVQVLKDSVESYEIVGVTNNGDIELINSINSSIKNLKDNNKLDALVKKYFK